MTYSCTGQMLSDWLNSSLGTFSFQAVDETGALHALNAYPSLISNTQALILLFDGSSDSYVVTAVQLTYSSCGTVWQLPVSTAKTPYMSFAIAVTLGINQPSNLPQGVSLEPIIVPALDLLSGVTPPVGLSTSASATEITYSTTTTSSGSTVCSSTISSTSTVNASSISYSGSGDTLTINANFSYGSCQQLEDPYFVFSLSSFNSGSIPACSSSPCYSTECGYNASCSTTAQIQISIS